MKNHPFTRRFHFAASGIRFAWKNEARFCAQVLALIGVLLILLALRAAPLWWMVFVACVAASLGIELFQLSARDNSSSSSGAPSRQHISNRPSRRARMTLRH